jgi:mannosyltransferase
MMKTERWELWSLLAILALALVLRAVGLNGPLWYDEIFTLTHFIRAPIGQLVTDFSSLNNHMFYSLQAKAASALFGESPWSVRVPAVLFGLASLVCIWRLGREAAGRFPALLATLLLAVSYHHVWFSQNARGYTGILFWTSAATLLLIQGLKRPSWGVWTGYALCVAAGMYTHLSSGFFFAAHAVVYGVGLLMSLVKRRAAFEGYPGFWDWRPIYGFGLSGVLTLLLHAPVITQAFQTASRVSAGSETSALAEWSSPLRTLKEILGSVDALGPLSPVAVLVAVGLLLLGLVRLWKRAPLLTIIYVVQMPLMTALLYALSFRIWPRYFLVDIGFIFLCLAAGAVMVAEAVGGWLRERGASPALSRAPLVAGVALMMAGSALLLVKNYQFPKQDFAGAVALIQKSCAPGDLVTSMGLASEPLKSYYAPNWPTLQTAEEMRGMLASGRTVWLVTAFRAHTEKAYPEAMKLVNARFTEVAELPGTLGDGTVRVFRSDVALHQGAAQPVSAPLTSNANPSSTRLTGTNIGTNCAAGQG